MGGSYFRLMMYCTTVAILFTYIQRGCCTNKPSGVGSSQYT